MRVPLIVILFMMVLGRFAGAMAQDAKTPASSDPAPGLVAENLYHGVNRAVMIRVTSPRKFGTVALQLMDAQGQPLADKIDVHPGRIDLADKLPTIWTLRATAYLQLLDNDKPIGSALVLQPMLSRMVPITELSTRPNGSAFSKIIDWKDENLPEMQAPPVPPTPPTPITAPPPVPTTTTDPQRHSAPGPGGVSPAQPPAPPNATQPAIEPNPEESEDEPAPTIERLFTGLRIYSEMDVVMRTSKGEIRIAFAPENAPNTVWNFLELCRGGFYFDVTFHRVVPLTAAGLPFVIQAGDPTGTGDGGPGYWLPIEPSGLPHDFGVISMARSDDPDSNGSQFFFCLSREGTARLDGQYCSFGYAVAGAATIKAIAETPLADVSAGRPAEPPVITATNLVPAPPRILGKRRTDERVTVEDATATTRPTRVPR